MTSFIFVNKTVSYTKDLDKQAVQSHLSFTPGHHPVQPTFVFPVEFVPNSHYSIIYYKSLHMQVPVNMVKPSHFHKHRLGDPLDSSRHDTSHYPMGPLVPCLIRDLVI